MCRLAAFPPGTPRDVAFDVLYAFAKGNKDGTGSVHLKDGQFVVHKYPLPYSRVVAKGLPLFDHMPHDGWTLAHLRAASHGVVALENTHPFIRGDFAVIHNGIWSDYELVKSALKGLVRFEGQTDSEVAAHLFATAGPKVFSDLVSWGGVFVGLKRDGELWIVRTSGDLEMEEIPTGGVLVGSTLLSEKALVAHREGWMRFSKDGNLIQRKFKPLPPRRESVGWSRFRDIDTSNIPDDDTPVVYEIGEGVAKLPDEDPGKKWVW